MLKYKNFDTWFVTKFIITENKIENFQKILNAELLKKYKFLASKYYEVINIELINTSNKTMTRNVYEYLITIGVKEFEDEN